MAERKNAEHGLVDAWTASLGGPRTGAMLDRLDNAVAWDALVEPILAMPEYHGAGWREVNKGGRPAWPALTMLKCVLPAKWFGLSDPQLEECPQDRLWFRRFVGLSLSDATPDETTFVRSRARLRERGLERTLFDATLKHLDSQGLLLKEGALVEATILEQSRGSKREDGTSTRDPEASFTKMHGETDHGCKGSINADRRAIVTGYTFSDAAPHDGNFIDELTGDETRMVVADRAHRSHEREARPTARGVACAIAFKRQKGAAGVAAGAEEDQRSDRQRASTGRACVRVDEEHGYRRVRCRGLRRNEVDFALNLIAYNWKRSLILMAR
jgi:IS5 family transposase